MADIFSISFPTLVESAKGIDVGAACSSNSNYYTSGSLRDTCCCGCDKE